MPQPITPDINPAIRALALNMEVRRTFRRVRLFSWKKKCTLTLHFGIWEFLLYVFLNKNDDMIPTLFSGDCARFCWGQCYILGKMVVFLFSFSSSFFLFWMLSVNFRYFTVCILWSFECIAYISLQHELKTGKLHEKTVAV